MRKYEKILSVVIALAVALSLCACGGSSDNEEKSSLAIVMIEETTEAPCESNIVDNRAEDTVVEGVADNRTQKPVSASFSEDDFEITAEYFCENSFATAYYVAIKNNSQAVVSISGNGIAKDSSGNALGAADMNIDVLGPGEESIGYFYFMDVQGVEAVEYELSYSAETYYYPVLSNLKVEQVLNDKNVTIKVTNNGNTNAQFVQAYAIFVDGNDNVVYTNSTYITDDDSEIKVGASLSAQIDAFQHYDRVFVYLTGRSDGKASSVRESTLNPNDFEVKEYLYNNDFASQDFVIVKNNSTSVVSVSGNATGFDASGNVVGAADMSIDVLGPGEESIGYFYFMDVKDVDHVEFDLSYSEEDWYSPVIADLDVQQTLNNKNVVVSVTNNGSKAAQFVQTHVLFFDANNNVVYSNSTYVTDDDSEIKPGKTVVGQIDCFNTYDHVEVYLTGRAD